MTDINETIDRIARLAFDNAVDPEDGSTCTSAVNKYAHDMVMEALRYAVREAFEEAARIADQYRQRETGNDSLDILSAISSYLGCGLGDENTTDEAFYKRIILGIDNHANCGIDFGRRQAFKEAAQIVENAPLAHSNTEIAAAIRAKVTP
ncbi:hypothetical protein [Rhizobium alvei]|uniref:Uncharacterized protein n=1 Tax=Rhizobium alvei TaxID=1132659 RepID=A0ABT8YT33_9HYPH|nr:hypothetical protein [Rhizobium alvei]MDO6966928.1 hypothetical protein [Rhizobium alvei]